MRILIPSLIIVKADNFKMKDKRLEKLGFNIKVERLRKKLSQAKLAEMANISMESVQKIETGKQTPSVFVFFDIQKDLGVPVETLYQEV